LFAISNSHNWSANFEQTSSIDVGEEVGSNDGSADKDVDGDDDGSNDGRDDGNDEGSGGGICLHLDGVVRSSSITFLIKS